MSLNKQYPRVDLGVLIFNEKKQLLLGQRLNSHGSNSWGPPGGHLEFGETLEECAIREVTEETGLIINSPEFVAITNDIFATENKHYVSIFMKAEYPNDQIIINLEPTKTFSWQWFNLDNLPKNLFLPLNHLLNGMGYAAHLSTFQPN